jgi:hypothetical protein
LTVPTITLEQFTPHKTILSKRMHGITFLTIIASAKGRIL